MYLICSHGRGGSPQDDMMQILAEQGQALGYQVYLPHDADIQNEPQARAERLIAHIQHLDAQTQVILAGFSMGGYCSVIAAQSCQQVRGTFLIAPALYLPHYPQNRYASDLLNVEIVHGWSDDVVLYEHSLRFARECNAPLHLLAGGHLLPSQLKRIAELFRSYLSRLNQ